MIVAFLDAHFGIGQLSRSLFMPPLAGRGRPSTRGDTVGYLMEPGTQRVAHPKTARPAHENQKSSLKGILRCMPVSKD